MIKLVRAISRFLTAVLFLASIFLLWKAAEESRYITDLVAAVDADHPDDIDEVALALAEEVFQRTNDSVDKGDLDLYERWEVDSFLNVSSAVSLKYGIYCVNSHRQFGPCGTMSRVLLNSLWKKGIPARKLHLDSSTRADRSGHTMVEYLSNGSWRVISPSDRAFAWRNQRGEVATVEEIRGDPEIFNQVFEVKPDYPYRFERTLHIRWSKLPPAARQLMRWCLGRDGYANAETPRIYDQPRKLLWITSAVGCSVFFLIAWGTGRDARTKRAETRIPSDAQAGSAVGLGQHE